MATLAERDVISVFATWLKEQLKAAPGLAEQIPRIAFGRAGQGMTLPFICVEITDTEERRAAGASLGTMLNLEIVTIEGSTADSAALTQSEAKATAARMILQQFFNERADVIPGNGVDTDVRVRVMAGSPVWRDEDTPGYEQAFRRGRSWQFWLSDN